MVVLLLECLLGNTEEPLYCSGCSYACSLGIGIFAYCSAMVLVYFWTWSTESTNFLAQQLENSAEPALPGGTRRKLKCFMNTISGLVLTKLSFHTDSIMLYKCKVIFLELMPILGYTCVYILQCLTIQYGNMALLALILSPPCK